MSGRAVSVRWLCAAGALLFAVLTTLVGESQGAPTRFLFLDGTVGLLFILSGLVAWSARPEVRTGPLLLASGVLWFVGVCADDVDARFSYWASPSSATTTCCSPFWS